MAEEKKFQYTSQAMPEGSTVFALILSGDGCAQAAIAGNDGFESFVSNATLPSTSHEDCLTKVPVLKKGWDKGKLCRYDVPSGQKGLRVAAIYFLGKREDSQPSLPAHDTTPSSSGDKGTVGGEAVDKKGRKAP